MVPHEAMFAKMNQIGIRGRMLGFVRALYAASEFTLRMPGAPTILLERGLRQGCPLSPILFDIFINDLYGRPDMIKERIGVEVPGMDLRKTGLIPGLLFADDLVTFASTRTGAQRQAWLIHEWCRKWEMKIGIKKCGIMCVKAGDSKADVAQASLKINSIWMGGEEVPVVEEYVYLGLKVRRDLDLEVMVKGRIEKAEKGLAAMRPFLSTQTIPIDTRIQVLKAVVLASAAYGGEIWGMCQTRCNKAQTVVNKALRIVIGSRETDTSIAAAAMWRELDVAPVHVLVSARRARAINKYPHLATWIHTILEYPLKTIRPAWAEMSSRWMSRYFPHVHGDQEYKIEGEERRVHGVPGRRAHKVVMKELWDKVEHKKQYDAAAPYFECGYAATSWAAIKAIPSASRGEQVLLGRGLSMVQKCRMKAFWTAARRAKHRLIDPEYVTRCPCCEQEGEGETVEHLLLDCSKWREEREIYIGYLIEQVEMFELPLSGRCTLLLGGEYMGHRLKDWLPPRRKRGQPVDPHSRSRRWGIFQVAKYLESIDRTRRLILGRLDRRGRSPLQSQGRNGRAYPLLGAAGQSDLADDDDDGGGF
jgi:hypothetical protein